MSQLDSSTFDERIEALTNALDTLPDVRARTMAKELLALVLQLHGEGLREFVRVVDDDERAKRRLLANPIVRSLLALHDLALSAPAPLIQIARPTAAAMAVANAPDHGGVCGRCGERLEDVHRHSIDLESRLIECRCRACWLLAGTGDWPTERAVPTRYHYEPRAFLDQSCWDTLRIPVDVAFFMTNSRAGRTFAFYPSPAGPTESALPLDAWHDLVRTSPCLQDMAPDVEALLVRREPRTGACECFIVPIDACYELVGRIRLAWTGITGGPAVQHVVDAFFADVKTRCGTEPNTRTSRRP